MHNQDFVSAPLNQTLKVFGKESEYATLFLSCNIGCVYHVKKMD